MSADTLRAQRQVIFVGAGPGDPGLLTLRAAEVLAEADVVILDQIARHDVLASSCRPDVIAIDASHGDHGEELTHSRRCKLIIDAVRAHPNALVVRLMDGDPCLFNGLSEELAACVKAGVEVEVVPGVSSATAVPTYAGVPLTSRDSTAVHLLAAGATPAQVSGSTDDAITAVVLGQPKRVAETLSALLAAGRDGDTPVALTEHGTTTAQRTTVVPLSKAAKLGLDFPVLAVVGPTVGLRPELSWFESKPLFGWQVLVPRTKEAAAATAARLADYGADAHGVPTIAVEPPRNPAPLDRAIAGLVTGRYAWVGFTSVNAVRAIRERLDALGLDVRALAGVRVAAVGGVTARALQEWGIAADLIPDGEESARGLLAAWPEHDGADPLTRVLLPRADIATDTLVAGLPDLGWEVDDVTAYRTVRAAPPAPEIRHAIKSGGFDAVVFTSSSTVRNLVGIAGKPHRSTVIACIGEATARTATELGLRVDVVAPTPSSEALVDALADHGRRLAEEATADGAAAIRPSQRRRRRAR